MITPGNSYSSQILVVFGGVMGKGENVTTNTHRGPPTDKIYILRHEPTLS